MLVEGRQRNEKNIEDAEDRLPYLNAIQDQCLKLRVQLNEGFDGNNETNVLLSMLSKSIRDPIIPKIDEIKKRYQLILNEEDTILKSSDFVLFSV